MTIAVGEVTWSISSSRVRGVEARAIAATISLALRTGKGSSTATIRAPARSQTNSRVRRVDLYICEVVTNSSPGMKTSERSNALRHVDALSTNTRDRQGGV